MAAVTVNRTEEFSIGNWRCVILDIDIAADGDTYVTGFDDVIFAVANSQTAGTGDAISVANSAGTLTFNCAKALASTQVFIVVK